MTTSLPARSGDQMHLPSLLQGCAKNAHLHRITGRLLRPYQIEVVERCMRSNTLIGLDMGLGKTAAALTSVHHLDHVSIVVPAVARNVWLRELVKWTSRRTIVELRGIKRLTATTLTIGGHGHVVCEEPATGHDFQNEWLLMTHESGRSWGSLMVPPGEMSLSRADPSSLPPDFPRETEALVIDEVHRFGVRDSQGTIAMLTASRAAERVFLLSGTPAKGGPHRLWAPLMMLKPWGWGSYYDFVVHFAGGTRDDYGMRPTGATNTDELARLLEEWAITYTRGQVADYLPPHTRQRLTIPLNGKAMRELGPIMDAASKRLKQRGEVKSEDAWMSAEVVALRLALAELKIAECVRQVLELQEQGQKVVVWCWHKVIARKVRTALASAKCEGYLSITGDLTDEHYVTSALDHWSDTDQPTTLIATMGKMGEARDLTAACHQIFLELDWLPETVQQAESRLVRLSQTRPVHTTLLALNLPFEQSLCDRLTGRAVETDAIFGVETAPALGDLFGSITMTDTEALASFAERVA